MQFHKTSYTSQSFYKWSNYLTSLEVRGLKMSGNEWQAQEEREVQRPEVNEKTNRGWWMMKEWFSSFSPPLPHLCVYSEIVICGGPFFLSCNSQLQIMRRQMEEPAAQIEMGWGRTKASIPCLMSLPWASSALSPSWMVLTDGTSRH